MLSRWLSGVAFLATVAVALTGCTQSATPTARPTEVPAMVRVATVTKGSLAAAASYSGAVQAKSQVNVLPKVAGRIEKLNVEIGSTVKAGDVIAELESATLKAQVAQAEAALALAEAKSAMIADGPRAEAVAQADAAARAAAERVASLQSAARPEMVGQAEANLRIAESRLEQLKKGATPEQVAAAKLAVEQSKNALWGAQAARDATCGPVYMQKSAQCEGAKAQVGTAETAVSMAQAQLAIVTAPPTAEQLAQAEAGVESARRQVELAKNPVLAPDLAAARAQADGAAQAAALAKNPFTANDKKAAQAGVDQAKAAVEATRLQLKDATIVAPFDGSVSQRFLSAGALAAPGTPIVALVSLDVEIVINVEESRLKRVEVGLPATVVVAAFAGEEFPAKVAAIAPSVDPRSRTLAVRVRPEGTGRLLDGMFAQVKLAGVEREPVLIVPAQAAFQRDGKSLGVVAKDGTVAIRELKLGASDGASVEVLAGLAEGESVVVSGQERLTDGQTVAVAEK
jgi:HlyD family secretion protein